MSSIHPRPHVDAALTIPLTDTLSVRVAGHFSHENAGYIKNVAGPIDNPFDGPTLPLPGAAYSQGPLNHDGAGRITVAWRPGDDFDATLKVLGSYHHDWGGATEEVFACGANSHPSTLNLLNPIAGCTRIRSVTAASITSFPTVRDLLRW